MFFNPISHPRLTNIEWPTLMLIVACTTCWMVLTLLVGQGDAYLLLPILIYGTTLHSSLQHEVLHGHPTRSRLFNEILIFPALGLLFPYQRFRRLHLQHHNNARLTDPLDDPESFYLPQRRWRGLARPFRALLTANNTFVGRLLLGPAISVIGLIAHDLPAILRGDLGVLRAWALHVASTALVVSWLVFVAGIPAHLYLVLVAYPATSLLMVRTFAEHRAHEIPDARSIIITTGPVMSLLFLNNNLHAVHHQHPTAPWYRLPKLFRENRAAILQQNHNYIYTGYRQLIRPFLLTPKEPVAHPLDQPTREGAG